MAKTINPVFTQNYTNTNTIFNAADTTTAKTIATAGADDSRVYAINIINTEEVSVIQEDY